jgi:hypothetical protein
MSGTKTGSCNCGAVAFEVTGGLRDVIACHCSICRRQTGHFAAFTAAWNEDFHLTRHDGLKWYRSGPETERGFCGACGSTLFFRRDGAERISIAAGVFDGATGLELKAHIFADDKGDYYEIDGAGMEVCAAYDHHIQMPVRKA